jgi:hypothetical protein
MLNVSWGRRGLRGPVVAAQGTMVAVQRVAGYTRVGQ